MASDSKPIPRYARFMLGGFAGMMATVLTQPMDLVKNRMQMSAIGGEGKRYKTSGHALRDIVRNEGVLELYNGLSAGLFRQATFTTTRMGVYITLLESVTEEGLSPNLFVKALCGCAGGIIGSFVGTPADVAMIRMTSDGRLPPHERRNYRCMSDALMRMIKEEGVIHLWTGTVPTMALGAIVNACQLTTYSFVKQQILDTGYLQDGIPSHFVSSSIAGLVTTIVSMPVDIAKTRIQNMKKVNGVGEYSGMLDVLRQVVSKEGVYALWKGFTPYYMRLGSHTVFLFIFLEQFTNMYRVYIMGDKTHRSSGF